MDDDYDDDYDLEYSDASESEPDVNLENQYYIAKGMKAEGDLRGALEGFQALLDIEQEKGDWGFKALKQMVKVSFRLAENEKNDEKLKIKYSEQMMNYYGKLLSYVKVVTKNYAEKSINAILDVVSNMKQMSLLHKFYDITLECLKESHNDRLWFKTNTKLAKLYLDEKDFANFDIVLNQLKQSCHTNDGDLDDKKGTQMLEIYALEIQKFTEQKNNKALHQLYSKALRVKSAIPHPLIMGTIRECGGKMYLRNGVYDQAHTDFFEAFKSYDESGSGRRIQCLKYLVLAAMLMKSDINPFDSQETKAFKNEPEIVVMNHLICAYQKNDLKEFQRLLEDHKGTILADDFVKEHITELIDNIRIEVVRKTIKPYTSVSLDYLANVISVSVEEVTRLLTQIILDKDTEYRIDQPANMLYKSSKQQSEVDAEREKAIDAVLDQLEMPGHFGGPRKGRDGTHLPTKAKSSGCPFNLQKLKAVHDEWKEGRRRLDEQIYKFETHYLEESSRISYLTKALKNPSRTLESLENDRLTRKGVTAIKPKDRIFSRSSFTSTLYDSNGPFYDELQSLRELDPRGSPEGERTDSPDFMLGLAEKVRPIRQNEKSVLDTSSEEEDFDPDGESVLDDAASEGTAQEDDDPSFDVESIGEDDGDDTNSGVFSSSNSRRLNRYRMTSGSVSPVPMSSRKRKGELDSDFAMRSRRTLMSPQSEYRYVPSCELRKPVIVRISSLLGYFDRCYNGRRPLPLDMCIRVSVYCNDRKVGPEVQTEYHPDSGGSVGIGSTEIHKWGETLELPVRYSELSKDAFLLISLWAADRNHGEVFVAQAIEPMFSKHGALHSGQRELRLDATPTGKPEPFRESSTPPVTTLITAELRSPSSPSPSQMAALANLPPAKPSRTSKSIPTIEQLRKQEKKYKDNLLDTSFLDQLTFSRLATLKNDFRKEDRHLYLVVDYPQAYTTNGCSPYVIVYYFSEDDDPVQSTGMSRISLGHPNMIANHDPDLGFENLHELKHQMMTRNSRALEVEKLLVPNPRAKSELEEIIKAPSCAELTLEKKDLIWKFRYFIQNNPNALTKFVRSVNWDVADEKKEAEKIIKSWANINIYDVLELLGPDFKQSFVRKHAVSRLRDCTDDVLLYLPQLVQALRYEHQHEDSKNNLVSYLIDIAADSTIANFLFWYLKVEIDATKMISDPAVTIFVNALEKVRTALSKGPSSKIITSLKSQEKFVQRLVDISKAVSEAGGSSEKKTENLRKILSETEDLQNLNGLALPVDPTVKLKTVMPTNALVYKSAQSPMSITFQIPPKTGSTSGPDDIYTIIFKRGDDLRQDQLVMQMIHIMDKILKSERLNLCLTPYGILATSLDEGFVQYIRATPVADFGKFFPNKEKKEYIRLALQKYRPSSAGPYGIEADAMDRFLRSCAGYCIISYILGIGDRHLHNVLLCEDGRIFHIDFGFILGRDPKPLPPPMKISPSMVFAMGGIGSQHYKTFVEYCRTAFTILQQHAKLITNLFGLMLDAGIPDIAIEKDKAVQKVLERFHLNIQGDSDEIAQLLDGLIESSIKAIMPLIADFVHDFKVGL